MQNPPPSTACRVRLPPLSKGAARRASAERGISLLVAALLAGCGFRPEKILASYVNVEALEAGRSQQCHTAGPEPQVALFAGLAALNAWQQERGVDFAAGRALPDAPYAVIEMGAKPTGGYGIAVSRGGVLRGDLVILQANFIGPPEGAATAQMLTSPCVLVRLPPGRYALAEVQDPDGTARARGGAPQPGAQGPAK